MLSTVNQVISISKQNSNYEFIYRAIYWGNFPVIEYRTITCRAIELFLSSIIMNLEYCQNQELVFYISRKQYIFVLFLYELLHKNKSEG